jgi:D-psicose/D-tagatose/L-ribulose 3-epimerase
MQFGLSGFLWIGSFEMEHQHLIDKTAELGFDLFEVPVFEPADLDGAELGSALRQSGLASSVCTAFPPDRSFISDDPAARLRARDHLVAAIDLAAAMGASHLIGPHGSEWGYKQLVSPDERRRQIDLCATGLREVADHAMAAGVVLAYECLNRYEIGFNNTIEEGLELVRSVDRPSQGIMLDTFHANIEERSLSGAVELAGSQLNYVHTADTYRGVPGTGHLDWDELVAALRRIDYDGPVVIETFNHKVEDIAVAAGFWRPIVPDPEQSATEGLRFLKEKFGQT